MSLKHKKSTHIAISEAIKDAAAKASLVDLAGMVRKAFEDVYDDLISNGIFTLDFNGNCLRFLAALRLKRTPVSASPYAMLSSDCYIGIDTTAAVTVNLLAAGTAGAGRMVIIKDETGNANVQNITVTPSGAETIDGAAGKTISAAYGVLRLISTGTAWVTI